MNSKERVLCAINLGVPDRVPMDFSANQGTLDRLYRDLNVSSYMGLLKYLHIDIFDLRGVIDPIYKGPVPKETYLTNGVKQNFWGMRTRIMETPTGPEECYCDFVLKDITEAREMDKHLWPSADWFDFSDIENRLKLWKEFCIMITGVSMFQHASFLRGLENLLMDMICNKELAHYLMDKFTNFYIEYFDRLITYAKGNIDILRIADDIGMQNKQLVGTNTFNEFFSPRIKKIVDMAHSHNVKIMYHSCGSIIPFIEKLIDLGVDILDPIQVRAKDMNPKDIKDNFGSSICLHGSIDTQYILPKGSVKDIEEEVKKMIDILGKNGGFIISPSHVLQTDVSTANVEALYSTAYKYGIYEV